MNKEERALKQSLTKFDKSNFAHVLYVAVFAVVAIILFAIFVIAWRSKKNHNPPFTKTPTARLVAPPSSPAQPMERGWISA